MLHIIVCWTIIIISWTYSYFQIKAIRRLKKESKELELKIEKYNM